MSNVIAVHIVFAVPALLLGGIIHLRPKGTPVHKLFGRVWVVFLAVTAVSSFWIFEIRDGFSPVHALSVISLVSITAAIATIRRGKVRTHGYCMIGAFTGLLAAAAGTLAPGRLIGDLLFGG